MPIKSNQIIASVLAISFSSAALALENNTCYPTQTYGHYNTILEKLQEPGTPRGGQTLQTWGCVADRYDGIANYTVQWEPTDPPKILPCNAEFMSDYRTSNAELSNRFEVHANIET